MNPLPPEWVSASFRRNARRMTPEITEDVVAWILDRLAQETGLDAGTETIPQQDLDRLTMACGPDPKRLKRWLRRRLAGEPAAYILGFLEFRGRRLKVDRRAFITDPETTYLVDAVLEHLRGLDAGPRRLAAEVGVGCGSLGISVAVEASMVDVVGVEIDPSARELAIENAAATGVELTVLESDLFESWGERAAPDVVFGDPPWGDPTTLYDAARSVRHYLAMPPVSAFPLGDRTRVHRLILEEIASRGWASHVFLNCGCLPQAEIEAMPPGSFLSEILEPVVGVRLLHAWREGRGKAHSTTGAAKSSVGGRTAG